MWVHGLGSHLFDNASMAIVFAPPARHLLRAKDLADARYAEPLSVDDLARAAGLSRRTSAASSAARSASRRTPTC